MSVILGLVPTNVATQFYLINIVINMKIYLIECVKPAIYLVKRVMGEVLIIAQVVMKVFIYLKASAINNAPKVIFPMPTKYA